MSTRPEHTCDTCAHQRPPAQPGAVPTCAKAALPNACVLALERAIVEHFKRSTRWLDGCPRWERK